MKESKFIKKTSVAVLTATILSTSITTNLQGFAEDKKDVKSSTVETTTTEANVTTTKENLTTTEEKAVETVVEKKLTDFKNGEEIKINDVSYVILDNTKGLVVTKNALDYISVNAFTNVNLKGSVKDLILHNKIENYVPKSNIDLLNKHKDSSVVEASLDNLGIKKETTNLAVSYLSASDFIKYNSENGIKDKLITIDSDSNYVFSDKTISENNTVQDSLAYTNSKVFENKLELTGKNKVFVSINLDTSKATFTEDGILNKPEKIDEKAITKVETTEPIEIINENTLASKVMTKNPIGLPDESFNNIIDYKTTSKTKDYISNINKDITINIDTSEKGDKEVTGYFKTVINDVNSDFQLQPMKIVNKFTSEDKSTKIEEVKKADKIEIASTDTKKVIDLGEYFSSDGDYKIEVETEPTLGTDINYAIENDTNLVIFNNKKEVTKNNVIVTVSNKKGDKLEGTFEVTINPYLVQDSTKSLEFKDVKKEEAKKSETPSSQYNVIFDTTLLNLTESNFMLLNAYFEAESDDIKKVEEAKITTLDILKSRLNVLNSSSVSKDDFDYLEKATKDSLAEIKSSKTKTKIKEISNLISEVTKLKLGESTEIDKLEQEVKEMPSGNIKDSLLNVINNFKYISLVKNSGKVTKDSLSSIEGYDEAQFKNYKKALVSLSKDNLSSFNTENISNLIKYINLVNTKKLTTATNIEALQTLDTLPNSTFKFEERIDLVAKVTEDETTHQLTSGFTSQFNTILANLNLSDINYIGDYIATENTAFEADYKNVEETTKALYEYYLTVISKDDASSNKALVEALLSDIPNTNENKYKLENLNHVISLANSLNTSSLSEASIVNFINHVNLLDDGEVKDNLLSFGETKKVQFVLENPKEVTSKTLSNIFEADAENKDFNLDYYQKLFEELNKDSYKKYIQSKDIPLFMSYVNKKLDTKDVNAYADLDKSLEAILLSDYKISQIAENRENVAKLNKKKEVTIENTKENNAKYFNIVQNVNLIDNDEEVINLKSLLSDFDLENFATSVKPSSKDVKANLDKETLNLSIKDNKLNTVNTVTVDLLDTKGTKFSFLFVVSSSTGYVKSAYANTLDTVYLNPNQTFAVDLSSALTDQYSTEKLKTYNVTIKDSEDVKKEEKKKVVKSEETKESFWSKLVNWVKNLFGKGDSVAVLLSDTAFADSTNNESIDLKKETDKLSPYISYYFDTKDKSVDVAIINDTMFILGKDVGNKVITISGVTENNLSTEEATLSVVVEKPTEFKTEDKVEKDATKENSNSTDTKEPTETNKEKTEEAK